MSYDEFMNKDPYLVKIYMQKHLLDIEAKNEELWLQGLYIHNAVGVCIANALSKKKQKYIEKPIRITPESEEEKEVRIEKERQKFINSMKIKMDKMQFNLENKGKTYV
jgi:CRISPR/Cas system-associated exonuclease Cas4 (RecB family)